MFNLLTRPCDYSLPSDLYPFFAFDDKRDPYNYQLTMLGSLAIWGSELFSSYIAREVSSE